MRLNELTYNKPRPRTQINKVYVPAGTRGAHPEKDYDLNIGDFVSTGKHFVWRRQPMRDKEGNLIVSKPHYDAHVRKSEKYPRSVQIRGATGEWLELMGATREDLAPALAKVRASQEYQDLLDLGFKEDGNSVMEKNGTLQFVYTPEEIIGDDVVGRPKYEMRPVVRRVLASGKVRGVQDRHGWPMNIPEPITAKSHPHMEPVDRVAKTMRNSIGHLVRYFTKRITRDFAKRLSN